MLNIFIQKKRIESFAPALILPLVVVFIFAPFSQAFADSSDAAESSAISISTIENLQAGIKPQSQPAPVSKSLNGEIVNNDLNNPFVPKNNPSSDSSASPASVIPPPNNSVPVASSPSVSSDNPPSAKTSQAATSKQFNLSAGASIASGKWLNSYEAEDHYPQPSSISGAFNYSVPLTSPSGRNGIEPSVVLEYNNQNTSNDSIVGFGWSLNIPYVERENKDSSTNMYTEYNFSSTIDGEFATSTATTTSVYGARFDTGAMNQYKYATSTETWTMTTKDGTKYTFGSSTSARIYNSGGDITQVARWMLEKVQDVYGNYMTYTYTKDGNQVYPSSIKYTGNGTSTGAYEIDFATSSRPYTYDSYKDGFLVSTAKHITEVDVKFNGNLITKYDLSYSNGFNTVRDDLQSVTQTGYDELGTATSLPSINFGYQTASTTWSTVAPLGTQPPAFADASGNDLGYKIYHWRRGGSSSAIHLSPSHKNAYESGPYDWLDLSHQSGIEYSNYVLVDDSNHDIGSAIVDVNGDGLQDIVQSKIGLYKEVYTEDYSTTYTSASTTMSNIPYLVDASGNDLGVRFGDFNGDGYEDYIISLSGSTTQLFLNKDTGAGWANATTVVSTIPNFTDSSGNDTGARVMDVNGDGVDDIVKYAAGDSAPEVYINTGDGTHWNLQIGVTGIPLIVGTSSIDVGTRIMDIDGDDLADFVVSTASAGTHFYINEGDGKTFVEKSIGTIPYFLDSSGKDIGTRVIDANADGLPDFVTSVASSSPYDYLSNGNFVDQLTSITLPAGGVISIGYQGVRINTTFLNTARTISVNPGAGGATTTNTYSYGNGEYQSTYQDRKFAGFGYVYDYDKLGNFTITYYHQGNGNNSSDPTELWDSASIGEYNDIEAKMYKPYRAEQYRFNNALGNYTLYNVITNKVDSKNIGGGRTFVFKANTVNFTYDGLSTHADSAISYDYATSTGNLIQEIDWGKVSANNDGTFTDIGSDDHTTNYTYASSTSSSVTNKPSDIITYDHSGSKFAETQYYYDNLSLGSVSLGSETKTSQWKTSTSYASSTRGYTSYGLVASSTDALGHTTSYIYDSYNLYPATTTNALGQATGNLYNYLIGKVKQTNDPNGLVTKTTYDGLGRVTAISIPDTASPSTLVTKTAYAYSNSRFPWIHETDYLNAATSTDSYKYEDGLSRVIQQRKSTENAGIYDVTDTAYNYQGLVSKQSLPYFSSGSASTTPTTTSALYTVNQYDMLGRLLSANNVTGTTTTTYANWMTHTTDPRGKAKDYYYDAFKNLASVVEYNAGSPATTTYAYDPNNNLISLTDASGNVRAFTYDGLGRQLTAQDLHATGDGTYGTWNYTYDDAGNLTQSLDPKSQTINYTYDALNRPSTEDYTSATGTEEVFGYDTCAYGIGHLCSATTTSAVSQYAYDANGNVAQESKIVFGTNYATQYTHDRQGNVTAITYPDNAQVQYSYGTGGLLGTVKKKENGESVFLNVINSFSYAPTGQTNSILYANGATTTNNYDASNLYRLASIQTVNSLGIYLQNMTYTYDADGNITQLLDTSSTTAAKTVNYTYDDLNRLTQAQITTVSTSTGGSWYSPSWLYRVPIAATSTKVLEDTHDVYLDLSLLPSDFQTHVLSTGCDIRVTKSDGTTELPIDLVNYATSTGGELHFSTGNALSTSSPSTYYVYYGNSGASCYAPSDTYGAHNVYDANTVGVWHLQQSTSTVGGILDSTSYAHNGTMYSNYSANSNGTAGGKLGSAATFNGTDETIDVPDSSDFEGTNMTLEGWVYMNALPSVRGESADIIAKKHSSAPYASYSTYIDTSDRQDGAWIDAGGTGSYAGTYAGSMSTGTWYYTVLRQNSADMGQQLQVRTNATSTNTYTASNAGTTFNSNDVLRFGADYAGGSRLSGNLDEIRVHNVALDDNYLATRYNDINSNATFWSVGTSTPYSPYVNTTYTETYSYDPLGNITNKSNVGSYSYSSTGYANPDAPTSVNGVTYTYDNNGNLTSQGSTTYTWDFLNHMVGFNSSAASTTYGFDEKGSRVFAAATSSTTVYPNMYFNSTFGSTGTSTTKNIFGGGILLAIVQSRAATSTSGTATTTSQTIYDDTLNGSWDDWSFNTTNNFSATTSYSGSYALQSIYTAQYGGLYLHNAGFSSASSTHLHFAFRSAVASAYLQVLAYGGSGSPLGSPVLMSSYIPGGTIAANTWYTVDIPLADMSAASTTLTGFVLQDNDASPGTVYYDDIRVINANGSASSTTSTYATNYIHPDNLGSTNVVADASGNLLQTMDYYPFGSIRISAGSNAPQRQFIGQYTDPNGLSYLNARYYDGNRGQFVSEDPIFNGDPKGQNLADPQSLNSYSYAENNPIIKEDPSGKCPMCVTALIGAGAGLTGQYALDVYNNYQQTGLSLDTLKPSSSAKTYLTRATQGALIGATGGLAAGAELGLAAEAGIVGGASGVFGAGANAYLGEPITLQSVFFDTTLGGVFYGAGELAPGVSGALPKFGTKAFYTGAHTANDALQLAVGGASNYFGATVTSIFTPTNLRVTPSYSTQNNSSYIGNMSASTPAISGGYPSYPAALHTACGTLCR